MLLRHLFTQRHWKFFYELRSTSTKDFFVLDTFFMNSNFTTTVLFLMDTLFFIHELESNRKIINVRMLHKGYYFYWTYIFLFMNSNQIDKITIRMLYKVYYFY